MAVVFSRIAFVWETTINLHVVSDNESFVVGIDTCTYPHHNAVFFYFIQLSCFFHSILQTADVLFLSVVGDFIICSPAREILLVLIS